MAEKKAKEVVGESGEHHEGDASESGEHQAEEEVDSESVGASSSSLIRSLDSLVEGMGCGMVFSATVS